MRPGEAAALTWARVRLEDHEADIVASYSRAAAKDTDTKTHQERTIKLTDLVVETLTAWRQDQRKETLQAGRKPRAYVFTNKIGSPIRQDGNLRRVFRRICKACGITGHSLYDLRSTFATTHLMEDYARLPWVSQTIGHKHHETTQRHYFKYTPNARVKGFANQIRKAT